MGALTWHDLDCGFGLLLEIFAEVVGDEEVVNSLLVCIQILSVRSNGGVEVILKLARSEVGKGRQTLKTHGLSRAREGWLRWIVSSSIAWHGVILLGIWIVLCRRKCLAHLTHGERVVHLRVWSGAVCEL